MRFQLKSTDRPLVPVSLIVGDDTYSVRFLRGRHLVRLRAREEWAAAPYYVDLPDREIVLASGMDAARLGDVLIRAIGEVLADQGREAEDLFE